MFTGIVAGMGEIAAIARQGREARLTIRPFFAMNDIIAGESIAVNGVCLSVEKHGGGQFTVYSSAETMARTNLGELGSGARVNLEQALKLGERLGGHIVSGHVDCLATVEQLRRAGESLRLRLNFPAEYGAQVISKGSVALNGISLTVNACGADFLEVNVIPDSQKRTNLPAWRAGSKINMETDIMGKYAQHLLTPWLGKARRAPVDAAFLARHGFL